MHYLLFFIDYMIYFVKKEKSNAGKAEKMKSACFPILSVADDLPEKGTPPDLCGAAGNGHRFED